MAGFADGENRECGESQQTRAFECGGKVDGSVVKELSAISSQPSEY
jgi:hypothetical protein